MKIKYGVECLISCDQETDSLIAQIDIMIKYHYFKLGIKIQLKLYDEC